MKGKQKNVEGGQNLARGTHKTVRKAYKSYCIVSRGDKINPRSQTHPLK